MDFLGSSESLSEDRLMEASKLASRQDAVFSALSDVLIKYTNRPPEYIPVNPVAEPQKPAGDTVKNILGDIYNGQ